MEFYEIKLDESFIAPTPTDSIRTDTLKQNGPRIEKGPVTTGGPGGYKGCNHSKCTHMPRCYTGPGSTLK